MLHARAVRLIGNLVGDRRRLRHLVTDQALKPLGVRLGLNHTRQ